MWATEDCTDTTETASPKVDDRPDAEQFRTRDLFIDREKCDASVPDPNNALHFVSRGQMSLPLVQIVTQNARFISGLEFS
jgi:hypothetical protein